MPLDDKELFRKLLQAYGAVVNKPFATARAFEWQPDTSKNLLARSSGS